MSRYKIVPVSGVEPIQVTYATFWQVYGSTYTTKEEAESAVLLAVVRDPNLIGFLEVVELDQSRESF